MNQQTTLDFDNNPAAMGRRTPQPDFDGAAYTRRDRARLTGQIQDIYNLMRDGVFRSLEEIDRATGHPQASISAQLRNLRKPRFGGYAVNRKRHASGGWLYQVVPARETGATADDSASKGRFGKQAATPEED